MCPKHKTSTTNSFPVRFDQMSCTLCTFLYRTLHQCCHHLLTMDCMVQHYLRSRFKLVLLSTFPPFLPRLFLTSFFSLWSFFPVTRGQSCSGSFLSLLWLTYVVKPTPLRCERKLAWATGWYRVWCDWQLEGEKLFLGNIGWENKMLNQVKKNLCCNTES